MEGKITVGTTVSWASAGMPKLGVVVAVLRAGRKVTLSSLPSRFRAWPLRFRTEESRGSSEHYVVARAGRLYHPVVQQLTVVHEAPADLKPLFRELSREAIVHRTVVSCNDPRTRRLVAAGKLHKRDAEKQGLTRR